MIEIKIYTTESGKQPFIEWLEALKNKDDRYRIKERLDRVALGNLGDWKSITGDLCEFRCHFSSWFRIYFGWDKDEIILLLCGGNKSSQSSDIKKAKQYWEDYLRR